MTATTVEAAWRLESVNMLPLSPASKSGLEHRGFELIGPFADALEADTDVGLKPQEREKCRVFLEDLKAKESKPDEDGDDEDEEDPTDEMVTLEGASFEDTTTVTLNGHPIGSPGAIQEVKNVLASAFAGEKVVAGQLPDRAEAWAKINVASKECDEAEAKYLVANERAKEAKKEFESSKASLREVIRWSNTPQVAPQPTLFDKPPSPKEDADNESWRDYPLERWTAFDLPKGVIKKLSEASPPITTVGELADFQAPKANGWTPSLQDITGIGKGAAEKLGAASERFWTSWRNGLRESFASEQIKTDEQ